jgi:hypothetical protein
MVGENIWMDFRELDFQNKKRDETAKIITVLLPGVLRCLQLLLVRKVIDLSLY